MKYFGVRLADEMEDSLKSIAKEEGQPLSAIIRFALSDFIKKNNKQKEE